MGIMRRVVFAVTGWLLAAAVAVVVGLLAVSLLGSGVTSGQVQPLSRQAVNRALARATQPSSAPPEPPRSGSSSPPASPARSPSPPSGTNQIVRAFGTPGGSIIARCAGSTVYLVSWSPRQGFEIDDHVRGPAPTAFIKFEAENFDVYTTVSCQQGGPVAHSATEHDD
jgi:hypothetical protein